MIISLHQNTWNRIVVLNPQDGKLIYANEVKRWVVMDNYYIHFSVWLKPWLKCGLNEKLEIFIIRTAIFKRVLKTGLTKIALLQLYTSHEI